MATIKAPAVNVLMTDGTEHTVKLAIADQLQWSRTSRTRKWDTGDELLATIFMAWHALKRSGAYTGTWEAFENDAAWVAEDSEDDGETPEPEDRPTIPAT